MDDDEIMKALYSCNYEQMYIDNKNKTRKSISHYIKKAKKKIYKLFKYFTR